MDAYAFISREYVHGRCCSAFHNERPVVVRVRGRIFSRMQRWKRRVNPLHCIFQADFYTELRSATWRLDLFGLNAIRGALTGYRAIPMTKDNVIVYQIAVYMWKVNILDILTQLMILLMK
jgi:hypothetical protein